MKNSYLRWKSLRWKFCKSLSYLFFDVESQVACRPRGKLVEDKILSPFSPFLFSRRWLFSRHNRSDLQFLSFRGIFSFKARHSAAWLGCLAKESSATILPIPCHANSRIRGTMRFRFVLGQFGELRGCKRFSFFPSLFCFLRLNGGRNLFAKPSWRWLQQKLGLWIARGQLAIIFLIPAVSNKQKVSFSDFPSSDVQIYPDIPDPSFQLLYTVCDVATRKHIETKEERRACCQRNRKVYGWKRHNVPFEWILKYVKVPDKLIALKSGYFRQRPQNTHPFTLFSRSLLPRPFTFSHLSLRFVTALFFSSNQPAGCLYSGAPEYSLILLSSFSVGNARLDEKR